MKKCNQLSFIGPRRDNMQRIWPFTIRCPMELYQKVNQLPKGLVKRLFAAPGD